MDIDADTLAMSPICADPDVSLARRILPGTTQITITNGHP
jgi:hypothetical protein